MIDLEDIQVLSEAMNIPFESKAALYQFKIVKINYTILVDLLKNGQYIFIAIMINHKECAVEHIEFYMNETKQEILQEAQEIIEFLATHDSKIVCKQIGNKLQMSLEVLKSGEWFQYGYATTIKL
ncbi:hypothetical protein ACFPAF_12960 [Hymenobacter endophyticus]|uniref:Uncharacterized protein n=1 Tax=Hymenobacter endophyticus TaxID=3076335 RepID=A0ABU3TIV0_9BACT|nr:hypothetical protein [Hymenobacter endophyticus]MDU0371311.1 hypothetical protein [Hymenobacter endophyticus]